MRGVLWWHWMKWHDAGMELCVVNVLLYSYCISLSPSLSCWLRNPSVPFISLGILGISNTSAQSHLDTIGRQRLLLTKPLLATFDFFFFFFFKSRKRYLENRFYLVSTFHWHHPLPVQTGTRTLAFWFSETRRMLVIHFQSGRLYLWCTLEGIKLLVMIFQQ